MLPSASATARETTNPRLAGRWCISATRARDVLIGHLPLDPRNQEKAKTCTRGRNAVGGATPTREFSPSATELQGRRTATRTRRPSLMAWRFRALRAEAQLHTPRFMRRFRREQTRRAVEGGSCASALELRLGRLVPRSTFDRLADRTSRRPWRSHHSVATAAEAAEARSELGPRVSTGRDAEPVVGLKRASPPSFFPQSVPRSHEGSDKCLMRKGDQPGLNR